MAHKIQNEVAAEDVARQIADEVCVHVVVVVVHLTLVGLGRKKMLFLPAA